MAKDKNLSTNGKSFPKEMEELEHLAKEAKQLLYFLCPGESHGESPEASS